MECWDHCQVDPQWAETGPGDLRCNREFKVSWIWVSTRQISQAKDWTEKHFHLAKQVDLLETAELPLNSSFPPNLTMQHPCWGANCTDLVPQLTFIAFLSNLPYLFSFRKVFLLENWTERLWRLEKKQCLDQASAMSINLVWSSFSLRMIWGMSATGGKGIQ